MIECPDLLFEIVLMLPNASRIFFVLTSNPDYRKVPKPRSCYKPTSIFFTTSTHRDAFVADEVEPSNSSDEPEQHLQGIRAR